jgi:hypothetical protein
MMIRKREKPKAMYDALTTVYSLVYRGNASPYSRKWRVEDCGDAFGKENELAHLFVEVMKQDKSFCELNYQLPFVSIAVD